MEINWKAILEIWSGFASFLIGAIPIVLTIVLFFMAIAGIGHWIDQRARERRFREQEAELARQRALRDAQNDLYTAMRRVR